MALNGKLIVVTREEQEGGDWERYLTVQGATVYRLPTIKTIPAESTPELLKNFSSLASFDWIIFTSGNGLRYAKLFAEQSGISIPPPKAMPRIAVVGAQTAATVASAGYSVSFQPSIATGEVLARELDPVAGKKVLLLRGDIARGEIATVLTSRGATVTDCVIYRTVQVTQPDDRIMDMIKNSAVDFTTFASPSAVSGFCARITNADILKMAKIIPAAAIGPTTRDALLAEGFLDVRMAKTPNIEALSYVMI
jgi:uroporphyrinogen-III synthase